MPFPSDQEIVAASRTSALGGTKRWRPSLGEPLGPCERRSSADIRVEFFHKFCIRELAWRKQDKTRQGTSLTGKLGSCCELAFLFCVTWDLWLSSRALEWK